MNKCDFQKKKKKKIKLPIAEFWSNQLMMEKYETIESVILVSTVVLEKKLVIFLSNKLKSP